MRVYEYVYTIKQNFLEARVWCDANQDFMADIDHQRGQIIAALMASLSPRDAAERLAKLPYCSAVEVRWPSDTVGYLIYPEWP